MYKYFRNLSRLIVVFFGLNFSSSICVPDISSYYEIFHCSEDSNKHIVVCNKTFNYGVEGCAVNDICSILNKTNLQEMKNIKIIAFYKWQGEDNIWTYGFGKKSTGLAEPEICHQMGDERDVNQAIKERVRAFLNTHPDYEGPSILFFINYSHKPFCDICPQILGTSKLFGDVSLPFRYWFSEGHKIPYYAAEASNKQQSRDTKQSCEWAYVISCIVPHENHQVYKSSAGYWAYRNKFYFLTP